MKHVKQTPITENIINSNGKVLSAAITVYALNYHLNYDQRSAVLP